MPLLNSDLVEPFDNPHPWTQLFQPQSLGNGEDTEENAGKEIQQGDPGEVANDDTKRNKLSARERLDKLPSFRIKSNALSFTSLGPCKRGGYAEVVQAAFRRRIWNFKKEVAVKKLEYDESMDKHKFSNQFTHEVELLAGLSHENIAQLIGFVENFESEQAWIILSWEPNGNVREFLENARPEIPERISLIQDTFEGLKYLHTRQPPICHGDLKGDYILVNSSYRAIITDFGSARVLTELAGGGIASRSNRPGIMNGDQTPDEESPRMLVAAIGNQLTLTGPNWTIRWASPEVLTGNDPGLPSDIWSAGWVCWEVITDKLPFPEDGTEVAVIMRVIQGRVPAANEDARLSQIVRLCSLMMDCWALDPRERPSVFHCCEEVKWVPSLPPSGLVPRSNVRARRVLVQMGRIHFLHSRYEDAAAIFQEVLQPAIHDDSETAEALHWLGSISGARCEFEKAEQLYTQARAIYARVNGELGQANALQGLGGVYNRQHRVDKAKESLVQAHTIYNKLGKDRGRASVLCELGDIYQAGSEFKRAEDSFIEAQNIYTNLGDAHGRAHTLQGLGSASRLQSKFAEAEEFFSQANSIFNRIGDDMGRANALLGLGEVYFAQSKYGPAKSFFTQALEINTRISNVQGQANALCGIGDLCHKQSEYTEAEACYTQAQSAYDRIGDREGEANTLHMLGDVFKDQSKNIQAVSSYIRAAQNYHFRWRDDKIKSCILGAQDACFGIEDDESQADALSKLAWVCLERNNYCLAVISYIRAAKIYNSQSKHDLVRMQFSSVHYACCHIEEVEIRVNMLCKLAEVCCDQNEWHASFAYMSAGRIYYSQSNYTDAETYFIRAKDCCAVIGEASSQADALSALGEVYNQQAKPSQAALSYTQAGDLYCAWKRYKNAASAYIQAEKAYAHVLNVGGQANALYALGEVYRHQYQYTEAESCYAKAKHLYGRIDNDEGRANALYGLGEVCHHQVESTEPGWYYTLAEEFNRASNDESRGKALFSLGDQYGHPDAETCYTEAKKIYTRIGNHHHQSKNAEAETCYNEAKIIYTDIGNGMGLVKTLLGLGEVYHNQFKIAAAETCYIQAKGLYTEMGDSEGLAKALLWLGEVYRVQSKHSEARTCYSQAEGIYTVIGSREGLAKALLGLGEVYRHQFKHTEAEMRYTMAHSIYIGIGHGEGQGKSLYGLGEIYYHRNEYSSAASRYIQAGDLYCSRRKYTEAACCYVRAERAYTLIFNAEGREEALNKLEMVSSHHPPDFVATIVTVCAN